MNNILLPSNNINPLEKIEKEKIEECLFKYLILKSCGLTNTGNKVALMVSPTNGLGKYDLEDHLDFLKAAYKYKSILGNQAVIFPYASSSDLRKVIQNRDFAHIFTIGHANFHSWRSADKGVNWENLGIMTSDHLKNGIFANIGCGAILSHTYIPLGYFVVNDHNNLIGYEAEYANWDGIKDFFRMKRLKRIPNIDDLINQLN